MLFSADWSFVNRPIERGGATSAATYPNEPLPFHSRGKWRIFVKQELRAQRPHIIYHLKGTAYGMP